VLQHVAVLQLLARKGIVCCSVLQCVAVCCSVLQCVAVAVVAVYCSVLQCCSCSRAKASRAEGFLGVEHHRILQ